MGGGGETLRDRNGGTQRQDLRCADYLVRSSHPFMRTYTDVNDFLFQQALEPNLVWLQTEAARSSERS